MGCEMTNAQKERIFCQHGQYLPFFKSVLVIYHKDHPPPNYATAKDASLTLLRKARLRRSGRANAKEICLRRHSLFLSIGEAWWLLVRSRHQTHSQFPCL